MDNTKSSVLAGWWIGGGLAWGLHVGDKGRV